MKLLLIPVWLLAGVGLGAVARRLSVWLARREELEPGFRRWQVYGPAILAGTLFAIFAARIGPDWPVLLIRSLWALVLVQVIFFDFEHRLILDRVMFPAMLLAILLSLVTPHLGWKQSLAAGLGAGILFLLISLLGALVMGQEAMGFGDVKLVAFIGLILGVTRGTAIAFWSPILTALLYGVLLAGAASVALIIVRRKGVRDTIAYGPFLAAGALLVLYQLGPG